jgi:hypothetical protein
MPVVGTVDTLDIDLEVWGPDTQAAITARRPNGTAVNVAMSPVAPPAEHPEQARKLWRGNLTYDVAGVWTIYPEVTGTGHGAGEPYPISVAPAGDVTDGRHSYATSTDYANVTREAPPLDIDKRLRDASAEVDELLHFANYPVDDAGLPTEPEHVLALTLATVEVVRWWDANGWDGSGAESQVQSASIAGVSLGFRSGKAGAKQDLVGDKARRVLTSAGLLGGAASAPWSY